MVIAGKVVKVKNENNFQVWLLFNGKTALELSNEAIDSVRRAFLKFMEMHLPRRGYTSKLEARMAVKKIIFAAKDHISALFGKVHTEVTSFLDIEIVDLKHHIRTATA